MIQKFAVCLILAFSVVNVFGAELIIAQVERARLEAQGKFANVKDKESLNTAVEAAAKTFYELESIVRQFDSFRRVNSGKVELRSIIDVLNATKPKIEALLVDLVLLKGKTLELGTKVIPHEHFAAFIDRIAIINQRTTHALEHLKELQKDFDCKFKRACYDDDLKAARNTLLQKITKIGDVEHHCKAFTKECSEMYKVLQQDFVDFQKERIRALYKSFDAICDEGCFPTEKQREETSKTLLEFDTKVKGWILTVKAKLKKLVEKKLNHLNEYFLDECAILNHLKINAKDNATNVTFLMETMKLFNSSLKVTTHLHSEFIDVFELLVFLEDVLTDDIFTDCFDRASTMYYLLHGFKQQIHDCIMETNKTILVFNATKNVTDAVNFFNNAVLIFHNEQQILQKMPEFEACPHVGRLRDSFDTFQADLEYTKARLEFLKKRLEEADLKACPTQPVLLETVTDKLVMVETYKGKNEENNCFVSVYDEIYCPNI